ncbi:MAG: transporter substrate-binding domain-containing protein [Burkholderiales bacterium]|jgi:polar amino acid transport system substrate-binding protein|nr:MAG: transporter substrate-binding domain-containing protein [Burkholderiales bacterium]
MDRPAWKPAHSEREQQHRVDVMRGLKSTRRATLIGLFLVVSLAARADRLVVMGDDRYAPVIYAEAGRPAGFLVDLLRRAQVYSGDEYDIQLMPWKRAYAMALRGMGGLIGVSHNSERAPLFDYSKPVYDDAIRVVVLKGQEFKFDGLEDLKGKNVGGVAGASYGEAVDRAIASGLFTVDRDIGQSSRLRKLLAGRLDAAFIGNGEAGFRLVLESHPELQANRERFVLLPTPLARDPLHLAFAKSMQQHAAVQRFDAAMERVMADLKAEAARERAKLDKRP